MPNNTPLPWQIKKRLHTKNVGLKALSHKTLQELVYELELQNDELRQTQQTLENSLNKYTHLYEFAPVGYVTIDSETVIQQVNATFVNMLGGVDKDFLLGKKLTSYIVWDDLHLFTAQLQKMGIPETKMSAEVRIHRANNDPLYVHLSGFYDHYYDGDTPDSAYIQISVADISHRVKLEGMQPTNDAASHTLLNLLTINIAILDQDGTIIAGNDAGQRFRQKNKLSPLARIDVGANYLRVCQQAANQDDEQAREALAGIEAVLKGQMPLFSYTYSHQKNGTERSFLLRVTRLPEVTDGVVIVHVDITPQKQAEEQITQLDQKLADERNLLELLLNTLPDYVYIKDTESRFITSNLPVAKTMGVDSVEALIGKTDFDFYAPELATEFYQDEQDIIRTGQPIINQEFPLDDSIGNRRWISTSKVPLKNRKGEITGIIGISRDITKSRELTKQLRHAQKMEAVGQVASGIAHHFNNLLTVLMGHTSFALEAISPDQPIAEDIQRIQKITQRAAALTRQLLAFARKEDFRPQLVNLNNLIGTIEQILRPMLHQEVNLNVILDPTLDLVGIDVNQFEQLIVNLVVNALDAMPNGGDLIIKTSNLSLSNPKSYPYIKVPSGSYVALTVTDTGTGMSREVQARIFEPFFTTKEVGRGTGLGLSSCYGIVQQHDGYIAVDSQPGQGTTFTILFPPMSHMLPISLSSQEI